MSTVSNAKSLLTEIKFHHRSYYYILSLSLSLDDALVGSRVLFFDERAKKKKEEEEEEAKKKNKSKISRILQRTMAIYSYNFILLFLANKKNTLPPGNK